MQIIFTFDTQYGVFCDALNLPEAHGFTDEQLEAMKQERLANWIAAVTTVPEAHGFTDEQLEAMKQERLANWIAVITAVPEEQPTE